LAIFMKFFGEIEIIFRYFLFGGDRKSNMNKYDFFNVPNNNLKILFML
jgi:hypothetical protein